MQGGTAQSAGKCPSPARTLGMGEVKAVEVNCRRGNLAGANQHSWRSSEHCRLAGTAGLARLARCKPAGSHLSGHQGLPRRSDRPPGSAATQQQRLQRSSWAGDSCRRKALAASVSAGSPAGQSEFVNARLALNRLLMTCAGVWSRARTGRGRDGGLRDGFHSRLLFASSPGLQNLLSRRRSRNRPSEMHLSSQSLPAITHSRTPGWQLAAAGTLLNTGHARPCCCCVPEASQPVYYASISGCCSVAQEQVEAAGLGPRVAMPAEVSQQSYRVHFLQHTRPQIQRCPPVSKSFAKAACT